MNITNPYPSGSIKAIMFNNWKAHGKVAAQQFIDGFISSGISHAAGSSEWAELHAARALVRAHNVPASIAERGPQAVTEFLVA